MSFKTFQGVVDRYNGVTVDSREESCELSEFPIQLSESLTKWNEEKKRCIWFKVNILDSAWIPLLANEGFNFHHSRDSFVMMYKWLPKDCLANLPPACHTSIGVGGMVFNDKNQILVVTEQHFIERPHWKLPGGYAERGEDIKDAAIREVKEETGIDAQFESMVSFRHAHNMMFGNSDIYFVVILKAITEKIVKSDIEIEACKWMDIDEYINDPNVLNFNRSLVNQALELRKRNLKLKLQKSTMSVAKFSREVTSLTLDEEV